MRTIRTFTAVVAVCLAASACDAMGPGPGRPFTDDRQYVLTGGDTTPCTAAPGTACAQVLEFHPDGTARVPHGNLVFQAQYAVRGSRVDVTPDGGSLGALHFDLSTDENTLTERGSGRVWLRYQLLRHLSRIRALA